MRNQENTDRREREQSAPRLQASFPQLLGLRIEVAEYSQIACFKYKKCIHVGSAPALFELRCNDERCTHGGYVLTHHVCGALRARETRSHGDLSCDGTTGKAYCGRRIHYELFADYRTA
jgi:hypothetical protein